MSSCARRWCRRRPGRGQPGRPWQRLTAFHLGGAGQRLSLRSSGRPPVRARDRRQSRAPRRATTAGSVRRLVARPSGRGAGPGISGSGTPGAPAPPSSPTSGRPSDVEPPITHLRAGQPVRPKATPPVRSPMFALDDSVGNIGVNSSRRGVRPCTPGPRGVLRRQGGPRRGALPGGGGGLAGDGDRIGGPRDGSFLRQACGPPYAAGAPPGVLGVVGFAALGTLPDGRRPEPGFSVRFAPPALGRAARS
jgi:hypothetical protein